MPIMKCKMCGGTLEVQPGESIAICDSCGTKQTIPKVDSEVLANQFNRANNLRLKCEFDKAQQIYEQIVEQNDSEAEAHWGIVLCKYGIEYVEDPKTHKRVPTCHRTSYESITSDVDYIAAVDYSDGYQQSIYESEARAIDRIQRDILEIVKNEKPFDVFICYKEADENGNRTIDSSIANDIYYQLSQEGFKVFYAAITLEDKLGQEYEPYIFAALNSAKVMLVIGTKPEYFTAVWVKNEWSRFMKLMKTDHSKLLIPCFKDMDAYELPDEFSRLQAQDMSKIGFINDVARGIKKVINTENKRVTPMSNTSVAINTSAVNTAPLLKRAFMFLEDGNWEDADEYCERVLDQEPENAQAYLGKLMAELHIRIPPELQKCGQPFDGNNNYQKALRFGDSDLKDELIEYIRLINERNEIARKDAVYASAKAKMTGESTYNYEDAIGLFKTISDWKDSGKQIDICQRKIEEIKAKEETDRIEAERQAELKLIEAEKVAKKRKKIISIATPAVIFCIAAFFVVTKIIVPNINYNAAVALMESGDYEAAITAFEAMDGYKDSAAQVENCEEKIVEIKSSIPYMKTCAVGDTLYFGAYEQDNNTSNGKEDIEWIVLDKDGANILVISKYALDCHQYDTTCTDVTWESCSLRKWMNGTFMNAAFNSDEAAKIATTTVTADKNPKYSTSAGSDTQDQVFLLSITEVEKYFSSDSARQCEATAYAKAQGASTNSSNGNCCWWWLRSPGFDSYDAAFVYSGGSVYYIGNFVIYDSGCVRPALWISIDN